MFIVRYRLPSGDFSEIAEARLIVAISAGHELREDGHGDITITDDSDGFVQPLDWWSTIERTYAGRGLHDQQRTASRAFVSP